MIKERAFRLWAIVIALMVPIMASAQSGQWNIGSVTGYGLPHASISEIITNIFLWLLGIIGIVAIIGFVISGLLYMTAAGNPEQSKTAKSAMMYSIYGVIVALSGVVIILAVHRILGAKTGF